MIAMGERLMIDHEFYRGVPSIDAQAKKGRREAPNRGGNYNNQ